jgi:hypothetical protein
MKKIYSAAMLFVSALAFLIIFIFACSKSNSNPPPNNCWSCEVKNAGGVHIDNKTFCSESDQSKYQSDHPGYTLECR